MCSVLPQCSVGTQCGSPAWCCMCQRSWNLPSAGEWTDQMTGQSDSRPLVPSLLPADACMSRSLSVSICRSRCYSRRRRCCHSHRGCCHSRRLRCPCSMMHGLSKLCTSLSCRHLSLLSACLHRLVPQAGSKQALCTAEMHAYLSAQCLQNIMQEGRARYTAWGCCSAWGAVL